MSFVSRLPAGNEILSMRSADLLKLLNDDGRVACGVPSALADSKEWAAALAWSVGLGVQGSGVGLGFPGFKPARMYLERIHCFHE